ncbi:endocuticle structural glycoprotein SgAbd-2-like [Cylas formicarius]|uniref:endocuticle structural glycoprotein SgAbd-2-like n=1 Tax=Cylas formicarius TaxID=197179 RepID=UPI0029583E72|nr:endocuticle structural glycoprotein SgAbd-2-like [Cylas formicarius]
MCNKMTMQVLALLLITKSTLCASLDNLYLPANQKSFANIEDQPQYSSNQIKHIPVLKFDADNNGEGSYRYAYETGNDISAQEEGDARGDGTKAHGSYSYVAPGGEKVSITYTADENGFQAQGSHIPTPPPLPEAIARALQQNAADEARGIFDDGQYRGEGLEEGEYRFQGNSNGGVSGRSGNPDVSAGGAASGFSGYRY